MVLGIRFLDLNLSTTNGTISILTLSIFRYGDVLLYGVYISQLIRFARASSHVTDFSCRKKKPNCPAP